MISLIVSKDEAEFVESLENFSILLSSIASDSHKLSHTIESDIDLIIFAKYLFLTQFFALLNHSKTNKS